ncbi:MarR family winged helix-turn-helix transcriptional regulator [Chthonobacter rhizosphaerae]|uniref:MarR family winged helix-turn-helix transcriptional regulator n=1 Tax=Chthonobacter rhizosphaerae TaxID=2735553 RepID=UPI0015EFCFBA|nr:MarR family transcriptional regulator [Chthonobacter rhizosphaerae]
METPLQNKVAALALAITDDTLANTDDLAPTAVAALISIRDQEPLSIGDIARVVGLTHSAAVRLVDRLEKDWLVRRQRRVGREVMVEITARGRRRAQQLQETRLAAVDSYLGVLNPDELGLLDDLVTRMIQRRTSSADDLEHFCRMCRRGDCTCGLHQDAEAAPIRVEA